jgi:hypothetical protein
MADSLISLIENKIVDLIGSLTVAGGFNYDWNGVIEGDIHTAVFPSANLVLEEEKNIDEPEGEEIVGPTGAFSEAYYNAIRFVIKIGGTVGGNVTPDRHAFYKALDDFKKIFGINYTLDNSGASAILYRGFKMVNAGGILMETTWLVRYYQNRKEPGETGEV